MILKDELTLETREDQTGRQSWRKCYSPWERKDIISGKEEDIISGKENMQMIPELVSTVAELGLNCVKQDSCP